MHRDKEPGNVGDLEVPDTVSDLIKVSNESPRPSLHVLPLVWGRRLQQQLPVSYSMLMIFIN